MDCNCIFCKIIDGQIPSYTLYEDDEFKVLLDRFPSSLGHTLVLPKTHVENIFELDSVTSGKIFKLAAIIATALKETLGFDGLNLLQNNGEAAGQTINHFHIHLIPRYEDDSIQISWTNLDPLAEEFEKLVQAIKEKI